MGEHRISVTELRSGLRIQTYSYVGTLELDQFRVHIRPKLSWDDTATFLAYALGSDTFVTWGPTTVQVGSGALPDVIALLLCAEVHRLIQRGLLRGYATREATLAAPRGRILLEELATQPVADTRLPCRFAERVTDIAENQILRGALHLAESRARQPGIVARSRALRQFLDDFVTSVPLSEALFKVAEAKTSRLAQNYRPALSLAYLLFAAEAPDPGASDRGGGRRFRSFLVDMDSIYQKFTGRLLREVRPSGVRIVEQARLPRIYHCRGGRTHPVRPDFVALSRDGQPLAVWDAKYKRYRQAPVDPGDLYQLTVYALALGPPWRTGLVFPDDAAWDGAAASWVADSIRARPRGLGVDIEVRVIGLPVPALLAELRTSGRLGPALRDRARAELMMPQ